MVASRINVNDRLQQYNEHVWARILYHTHNNNNNNNNNSIVIITIILNYINYPS